MAQTGLHGNAWLPCSPVWAMQLLLMFQPGQEEKVLIETFLSLA